MGIVTTLLYPGWEAWAIVTILGCVLHWGRLGRKKVRVYVLSEWLDTFMKKDGFWRVTIEILLFVSLGTILALGLVQPKSFAQALAAGFGWTSLLAKQEHSHENEGE